MSRSSTFLLLCFVTEGRLCLLTGLGEAVEKLSDDKVDASGMEAYTHQITKVCMQKERKKKKKENYTVRRYNGSL